MTKEVDTIIPRHPFLNVRAQVAPWFTEELWAIERQGRQQWKKTRAKSNSTRTKTHFKVYFVVVVMAAKKQYFPITLVFAQCRPAELF